MQNMELVEYKYILKRKPSLPIIFSLPPLPSSSSSISSPTLFQSFFFSIMVPALLLFFFFFLFWMILSLVFHLWFLVSIFHSHLFRGLIFILPLLLYSLYTKSCLPSSFLFCSNWAMDYRWWCFSFKSILIDGRSKRIVCKEIEMSFVFKLILLYLRIEMSCVLFES